MPNMVETYEERIQAAKNTVDDNEKLLAELPLQEYYRRITSDESYLGQEVLGRARRWILERYYNHRKGTVLDVGCGVGGWSYRLSDMGNEVTGIEKSAEKFSFLQKIQELFPRKNPRFILGNAMHMTFFDRWFDACDSCMVLEHVRNPIIALREMKRVSRFVTGIVHMGKTKEENPYHLWFMNKDRIEELLDYVFGKNMYEIGYIDGDVFACFAAEIPHPYAGFPVTEIWKEKRYARYFDGGDYRIVDRFSKRVELDDIIHEDPGDMSEIRPRSQELIDNFISIMEMGRVDFLEDPFLPIHLLQVEGRHGYVVFTDGWHRIVAMKRCASIVKNVMASVTLVRREDR